MFRISCIQFDDMIGQPFQESNEGLRCATYGDVLSIYVFTTEESIKCSNGVPHGVDKLVAA